MDINKRLRTACNGLGLTPVGRVPITGYAGYQVCQDVFADLLDERNR